MTEPFVFCDETFLFRQPADPGPGEAFALQVWTERISDLKVSFLMRCEDQSQVIPARKVGERGLYDIWEIRYPGTEDELLYMVHLALGDDSFLYGRNGICSEDKLIPFSLNPSFHVPEWARGALWYQIFPDRFYNGDLSNDVLTGEVFDDVELVSRRMHWEDAVTPLDVHHSYGGDLKGILDKLDYISSLGVEVLYLNPVFVAPSSHGYNTQDYDHVDPHFGCIHEDAEGMERYRVRTTSKANLEASDQLLAELIRRAHQRGIRVILDGVFNHCSSFHPWSNEAGLYDPAGERPDFFREDPETGGRECWWGNRNLLKLDVDGNEELRNELLRIAAKWISPPFEADGWRLDVAADVGHSPEGNHTFWRLFREKVRSMNPEALILAEHYGDPSEWLGGDEWDSVMNYDAFMEPVSWFFTGMEKHSDRYVEWMEGAGEPFAAAMTEAMARFPRGSLEAALNQLDNHDHSRFLSRTNHVVGRLGELGYRMAQEKVDKALLREAVLLQMTWPGAPGIYYGDEAGLCGFTDPDNRRPFPWGGEDAQLQDFYSHLGRLRKQYPVLKRGSFRMLRAQEGLLIYGRLDISSQLLILINQSPLEMQVTISTRELDGIGASRALRLVQTWAEGYNLGRFEQLLPHKELSLSLKPREALVYELLPEPLPAQLRDFLRLV